MSLLDKITIDVSKDRTRAWLREFPPYADEEDINAKLKDSAIVSGIREENIAAVLAGKNSQDFPLAEVPSLDDAVTTSDGRRMSMEQLHTLLKETDRSLSNREFTGREPFALFVKKGDEICTVDLREEDCDIFGNPLWEKDPREYFDIDSSVQVVKKESAVVFSALTWGYPVIRHDERFSMAQPFEDSKNRMRRYFLVIPVVSGEEDMYSILKNIKERFETKHGISPTPFPGIEQFRQSLQELRVRAVLLYEGRPKQDGHDSRVRYFAEEERQRERRTKSSARVDMKSFNSFVDVSRGERIAEKIHSDNGVDGVDVTGNVISAYRGKDTPLICKAHVQEEEDEGKTVYRAEITGILKISGNKMEVVEELVIDGDAGIESGNIRYAKDIIVKGNLCTGYRIDCGGSLSIGGSVEKGSCIRCAGNLYVESALFGEDADVEVDGNCEIGFIQDSRLQCGGNLIVRGFIWHSKIFCKGHVRVDGQRVKGQNSAVVGGEIVAMKGMVLHSAGAQSSRTTLCGGVNPALRSKEDEIRGYLKNLTRVIASIQNSIGFNLQDKHNLRRLNLMNEKKRKEIRKKLMHLRGLLEKKKYLEEGLARLDNMIYSSDESIHVVIKGEIFADVSIQMIRDATVVTRDIRAVDFSYSRTGIRRIPYSNA
ncbi:MAG: FapA family protein [Fibrobacterota bacterium]